jgi:hypothetical protein
MVGADLMLALAAKQQIGRSDAGPGRPVKMRFARANLLDVDRTAE